MLFRGTPPLRRLVLSRCQVPNFMVMFVSSPCRFLSTDVKLVMHGLLRVWRIHENKVLNLVFKYPKSFYVESAMDAVSSVLWIHTRDLQPSPLQVLLVIVERKSMSFLRGEWAVKSHHSLIKTRIYNYYNWCEIGLLLFILQRLQYWLIIFM